MLGTSPCRSAPVRLLARPEPCAGESLAGYMLRVAEANGYPSGRWIARHFLDVGSQTMFLPWELCELSQLLGRPESDLYKLAYLPDEERRGRYVRYFGQSMHFRCMKTLKPALCPICLEENPVIHGFWELSHVAVCPLHNIRLTDQCPQCRKQLSWDRSQVCACNCGFDFREVKPVQADGASVELTKVIYSTASFSLLEQQFYSAYGLPLAAFRQETSSSLIWMILSLARYIGYSVGTNERQPAYSSRLNTEYSNLIKVGELLSNWPENFLDGMYGTYVFGDEDVKYLNWKDARYLHPLYKTLMNAEMPSFLQEIGKAFFSITSKYEREWLLQKNHFHRKARPIFEATICF